MILFADLYKAKLSSCYIEIKEPIWPLQKNNILNHLHFKYVKKIYNNNKWAIVISQEVSCSVLVKILWDWNAKFSYTLSSSNEFMFTQTQQMVSPFSCKYKLKPWQYSDLKYRKCLSKAVMWSKVSCTVSQRTELLKGLSALNMAIKGEWSPCCLEA